jgi:hypothetical protein
MLNGHTELPGVAPALAERAAAWLRTGIVLATLVSAGFYLYWTRLPALLPAAPQQDAASAAHTQDSAQGKRRPVALSAAAALLPDDAEVIGVTVAGHARAYLLRSVAGHFLRHVVNDVVGGCPITVTYCDRSNCSQVFTGPPTGAPLDVPIGYWSEEHGLVFRIDGVDYAQKTGANLTSPGGPDIPYTVLPHVRTSWREWREAHPDTDIFTGYYQTIVPKEAPVAQ